MATSFVYDCTQCGKLGMPEKGRCIVCPDGGKIVKRAIDLKETDTEPATPKAKRKKVAEFKVGELEKFEVIEVHRSELKNAPYNPRHLSDKGRERLKLGMKKFGLLAPQTWNRRTGNLVGGHQRTKLLDDLYGTDDYRLKVAAVDLDDKQEMEANLLLNNQEAMADWDLEKLEEMFKNEPLDIPATGFDVADLYRLFGDTPFTTRDDNAVDELAERLSEAKKRYTETTGKSKKRDTDDFYLVVVFKDAEARDEFTQKFGLDDNRYQDGREIQRILEKKE